MVRFLILITGVTVLGADVSSSAAVTFNKDVLPIFQAKCQSCHRPGQVAPMSLLTYESTRPWAKAIKAAVVARKMPPWFADPRYGHFANDISLKPKEIEVISAWADNGSPEGSLIDALPPVKWPDHGWRIQPEVVATLPDFPVPPKGTLEWMNITIPSPFKVDTWVNSLEILPSEVGSVHHMCIYFKPHKKDTVYNQYEWMALKRDENQIASDRRGSTGTVYTRNAGSDKIDEHEGRLVQTDGAPGFDFCYVPGNSVLDYRPYGAGRLIPADSDIVMNIHYNTTGKALVDKTAIGFTVAKAPPARQFVQIAGDGAGPDFAIPPREGNYAPKPVELTFDKDVELVWVWPHMHLRGKDMTFKLEKPDGSEEVILAVPRYDFNWQLGYITSVRVPKGATVRIESHYDNSSNNPFNPNPNLTVRNGNQTWEEMFGYGLGVIVDKGVDAKSIVKRYRPLSGA